MDGQKMQGPASQGGKDESHLVPQVPEFSGFRDHGESIGVQGFHQRHQGPVQAFAGCGSGRAELPDKGVVDDIGAAGAGRFHIDDAVVPFRPHRIGLIVGDEKTFGLEISGLMQGQQNGKGGRILADHLDIIPALVQLDFVFFHPGDDLLPGDGGGPQVGAHPGVAGRFCVQCQIEPETVPPEHDPGCARHRRLCNTEHRSPRDRKILSVSFVSVRRMPRIDRTFCDYITTQTGLQKHFSVFMDDCRVDGQMLITAAKTHPPARAVICDSEMEFRQPGVKFFKHRCVGFKGHPAVIGQAEHAGTVMDHQVETGGRQKPVVRGQ